MCSSLASSLYNDAIVNGLKHMIDQNNPYAQIFRIARDRFRENQSADVRIKLINRRETDGRRYNLPQSSEVAALIVGDGAPHLEEREIILERQTGALQRISELTPCYLPLHYPLLFPYGEDGYRINIGLTYAVDNSTYTRSRMSMREFFAYIIQQRQTHATLIGYSGKLFQQFLVDAYTMIESERLCYIRTHQKRLRSERYNNLQKASLQGNNDPSSVGKRIVLPSSFTGSARYMVQNYQDAMAICRWYGHPDLFITFTCNSKWPEIVNYAKEIGVKVEDKADFVSRVFKIKLDQLIRDLMKNNFFGRAQASKYFTAFNHSHCYNIPHE